MSFYDSWDKKHSTLGIYSTVLSALSLTEATQCPRNDRLTLCTQYVVIDSNNANTNDYANIMFA